MFTAERLGMLISEGLLTTAVKVIGSVLVINMNTFRLALKDLVLVQEQAQALALKAQALEQELQAPEQQAQAQHQAAQVVVLVLEQAQAQALAPGPALAKHQILLTLLAQVLDQAHTLIPQMQAHSL